MTQETTGTPDEANTPKVPKVGDEIRLMLQEPVVWDDNGSTYIGVIKAHWRILPDLFQAVVELVREADGECQIWEGLVGCRFVTQPWKASGEEIVALAPVDERT